MAETINVVSISRESQERYLRYAVSVISSRALPDVRDGLKPVQRRILYTMFNDLHLDFDGRCRKCAQIVGDVMGKYHPHGDSAIYEALVRQSQSWVMLVPLVHGQGNFGSVDGDPPAAYRYTEAKLSAASDFLLRELRQNTVDTRPTYDSMREEPVVLPAEFPNLLVNGSSGIAVGMATEIPPHNLAEVVRACLVLIDDPEASTADLMQQIHGPDFPLGGKVISDRATMRKIYEEGRGSVKVQAEWSVEGEHSKKPQIIVRSIPYGTDKSTIENDIGQIIELKKVPQLVGLTNESSEETGLRIAIDIKPGTDTALVMAYLYKHTDLQSSFAFNLTCLIPADGGGVRPARLGLQAILKHFLRFRMQVVRRRFEHELGQLRRRIHLLDGFRIVFDDLDRAIEIVRGSQGRADSLAKLMAAFALDDEQAGAVVDAQLYKIAGMEIAKILEELRDKKAQAAAIERILASEVALWAVIRSELEGIVAKYPQKRRTRMALDEGVMEFDEEAYIVRENTNVVLTRDGWIKRVGRLASVEGTRVRDGDEVIAVVPGSTLDNAVFFADDGTSYTMRINEIPASSGYGEPISKFFKIADRAKIIAAETTDERFLPAGVPPLDPDDPEGPYLLSVTSDGMTLRTPYAAYRAASTKNGRRYIRLTEGERAVMVRVLGHQESLFLASEDARLIHFRLDQISILSGAGKGVVGIRLLDGANCLGGMLIARARDTMKVEASTGAVREFRPTSQPLVNRGGRGAEILKRGRFLKVVPEPVELPDWEAVEAGKNPGDLLKQPRPRREEPPVPDADAGEAILF